MTRLPAVDFRTVEKLLLRLGFERVRQKRTRTKTPISRKSTRANTRITVVDRIINSKGKNAFVASNSGNQIETKKTSRLKAVVVKCSAKTINGNRFGVKGSLASIWVSSGNSVRPVSPDPARQTETSTTK